MVRHGGSQEGGHSSEKEIMTANALKEGEVACRVCLWAAVAGSVIKQIPDPVHQSMSGNDFSSC